MAYGVHSRKFCCCLPVRFGVFVLSLVQCVSSAFLAGVMFWALNQKRECFLENTFRSPGADSVTEEKLETNYKIIATIVGAISAVLAIVCLLGFIGSISRRQNLVRIYSMALNYMIALSIGSGIIAIGRYPKVLGKHFICLLELCLVSPALRKVEV